MPIVGGSLFGRYEIHSLLGVGGMGEVYLAHDRQLRRPVALKVLSPDAEDIDRQGRLEHEACAASALNHPNILTIYEIGEVGQEKFIATEFVEGKTIRQLIAERTLTLARILDIAAQVCSALAAAEAVGIVHRDIKPDNIMVRPDGYVKVLDFGLAKRIQSERNLADSGPNSLRGTIYYMSPEQLRGLTLDSRTDIWSIGVVLYEMLTGILPFFAASVSEIIAAILRSGVLPPSKMARIPFPESVEAVVLKALEKERSERFQTIQELLNTVREVSRSISSDAAPLDLVREWGLDPDKSPSDPRLEATALLSKIEVPNNIPPQLTAMIGREEDSAAALSLLRSDDVKLLTFTGPGGAGKTRLAIHVASLVLPDFPDGVFFVPLASVTAPSQVAGAIAAAVGVKETAGDLLQALKRELASKRILLVLDTLEQITAAADQIIDLISSCEAVKVLATSRARLNVRGERELAVPPLAVPDPRRLNSASFDTIPAVALFVERARAVSRDFELTDENREDVARICSRLEGLPLAIELAAARIKFLTPKTMLARLENRLSVLAGGARDLLARQQTMRGAISWGYNLLDDVERQVFNNVCIFSGGFSLAAADAVCAMAGVELLDILASLVDKSFLRQELDQSGEPRFSMLEVLREYGWSCLTPDQLEDLRARHAAHYVSAVESESGDSAHWLDRIDCDIYNVRGAFEWLVATGQTETALRIAGRIWWWWYIRGRYTEGRVWLETVLTLGADAPPELRAPAMLGAGVLAFLQCDYDQAESMLDEAGDLAREAGDRRSLASSLQFRGSIAREKGDCVKAIDLHELALVSWEDLGDQREIGRTMNYIAFAAAMNGDLDRTRAVIPVAREIFDQLGDREGIAWTLLCGGLVALYSRDFERARQAAHESLAAARLVGFQEGIAWALNILGSAERRLGDAASAGEHLRESLDIHWRLGDRWRCASVLEALAGVALDRDDTKLSLQLFSAADGLRGIIGTPIPQVERNRYNTDVGTLRKKVGIARSTADWVDGSRLTLDEVVGLVAAK